jgi:nitroreductase
MDLLNIIRERKSVRAFRPESVPREKIEEITDVRLTDAGGS